MLDDQTSPEIELKLKSVMGQKSRILDLEAHFAFYGAYHRNPANILIHKLFVWPIFFTSLMLLHFTPSLYPISTIWFSNHFLKLNFGFFFTLLYALFYLSLDTKAGALAAGVCFACWFGASYLSARLGFALAWKVAVGAQLFCMGGQLLGHGIYEKRAPALVDNFSLALLIAPFFVLLEVLQTGFGYEPYSGFFRQRESKDRCGD